MISLLHRSLWSLLLGASLSLACMASESGTKNENSRLSALRAETSKGDYILQPGDLIRVLVFQEEDINKQGEVRLSQESAIALPLIGQVDMKGKTVRQAEDLIRKLYAGDYLVHPQVTVFVAEYAKRVVQVLGSVTTPGVVVFPQEEGLTLLEAISRAGGFNRLADKKHVTLTRGGSDGKAENYTINAEALIKGDSNDSWTLQPGDVISVPERIL